MNNVGLIILAAGKASRMGKPKQLLAYQGSSLISHAVKIGLNSICKSVVVVLGAYSDQIKLEIDRLAVEIVENPLWQTGMASSIRVGVAAIKESNPNLDAVIIALADQPLINAGVFNRLIQSYQQTGNIAFPSVSRYISKPHHATCYKSAAVATTRRQSLVLREPPQRAALGTRATRCLGSPPNAVAPQPLSQVGRGEIKHSFIGGEVIAVPQLLKKRYIIIASAYDDIVGVPALFNCALFPELMQLVGDKGAKALMQKYQDQVLAIPVSEAAIDIDTPDDYEKLLDI